MRLASPNFASMALTWFFTVFSVLSTRPAIWRLVSPSAMSPTMRRSVTVNEASPASTGSGSRSRRRTRAVTSGESRD